MSIDDIETPPEDLSPEQLIEALDSGEVSVQEIRESEVLRQRVRRLIVKQDMEEHREIYDRLAEV